MDYAHYDTSKGERHTPTAKLNKLRISDGLQRLRADAFAREIPTADDETLQYLLTQLSALQPENILELGTATGISGIAMLEACPFARLTTVEKNPDFFAEARRNFSAFGLEARVNAIYGDAYEVSLTGEFSFIFLDCAKVQYIKLLPLLKKLLRRGGMLVADDVLLFGWATGEAEVPKKRKMLYTHICEYLQAVTDDKQLLTTVLNIGDGLAVSVKL